jgi:hypothetical protein
MRDTESPIPRSDSNVMTVEFRELEIQTEKKKKINMYFFYHTLKGRVYIVES